jgi:hypothetical protein
MVWHSCLPIVAKRRVIPAADNALGERTLRNGTALVMVSAAVLYYEFARTTEILYSTAFINDTYGATVFNKSVGTL